MKKKIFAIFITILLLVALPSCAGILVPPEGLMRPPTPRGVSAEILAAFEREVGAGYRLRFERGGNHTSVLTYDLTGNGNLNAAIFYSLLDEGDALRIHILEQNGNEWNSIYDKSTAGLGVERIEIGYIIGNDTPSLVVGKTSLLDNQRILTVFNFERGVLHENFTANYMEFYVADIDRDGLDNVIFMQYDAENSFIDAQVAGLDEYDSQIYIKYSAVVDSEVSAFIGVQSAPISSMPGYYSPTDMIGIYFDAVKADGRIITELLYIPPYNYDEGYVIYQQNLHAPFTDVLTRINTATERRNTRHSADISGNGQIAIPIDTMFAGSEDMYKTGWHVYYRGQLTNVLNSYVDRFGFMFDLENLVFDNLTINIAINEETRERVFSVFDVESQLRGRELFRIILTTETWWQENSNEVDLYEIGWFQNVVFLVQMVDNEPHGDGFDITIADIQQRFALFHDTTNTSHLNFDNAQGD